MMPGKDKGESGSFRPATSVYRVLLSSTATSTLLRSDQSYNSRWLNTWGGNSAVVFLIQNTSCLPIARVLWGRRFHLHCTDRALEVLGID